MSTALEGGPHHPDDDRADWHHHLVAGVVASYAAAVYIEIGICYAGCWLVAAPFAAEAHGVDPAPECGPRMGQIGHFWNMGSDQFFKEYNGPPPDVVFVDGEHVGPQVGRDCKNALAILKPFGTMIMHDTQPLREGVRGDFGSGTVHSDRLHLEQTPGLEVFTFQRFPGVSLVRRV